MLRREVLVALRHFNRKQMSVANMQSQVADASQRGWQVETAHVATILKGALGQLLHALGNAHFSKPFTTCKRALTDASERGGETNLPDLTQISKPAIAYLADPLLHDDGLYLLSPCIEVGVTFPFAESSSYGQHPFSIYRPRLTHTLT